ncbi:DUF3954 domain-containing protein [Fictibacillus sp. Mic-4]|uniref:DUF3954 domain-containing protein n=1 Tax=Fictibacillus sp. Mic-4 TaxID=3132826 RepID=UPI003CEB3B94
MNLNLEKMTTEISLLENCILVVKDGYVTKINAPSSGHGKQTAIWRDGRVIDVLMEERVRIE